MLLKQKRLFEYICLVLFAERKVNVVLPDPFCVEKFCVQLGGLDVDSRCIGAVVRLLEVRSRRIRVVAGHIARLLSCFKDVEFYFLTACHCMSIDLRDG